MADATLGDYDNKVHCGGVNDPVSKRCNGATIRPGSIVMASASATEDIELMKSTDVGKAPFGVVGLKEGHEIETVYDDGESVPVHLINSSAVVWICLEAIAGPIAVYSGDTLAIGTEDGKARKWGYTNAATITDSLYHELGVCQNYNAGHASDDKWVRCKI